MRGNLAAIAGALALAGASGTACAMNASESAAPKCLVIGADKLPAEAGDADVICAAIERAVADQDPGARYRVEVRVISATSLAAVMTTAAGERLPEQRIAVSDRKLGRNSIERFARAIAASLANAGA